MDSCAVADALLQELTLHTAHRIVDHGTSFAVDGDAPALTIAREDDKRADVRRVLHPRAMIARAVPRLCERDQSRVHRRGLEAVAVVAALPAVLVAQHGLRCADPAAHGLRVPSGDHGRRMQIQVAPQRAVFDARAQQKGGAPVGPGGEHDAIGLDQLARRREPDTGGPMAIQLDAVDERVTADSEVRAIPRCREICERRALPHAVDQVHRRP